MCVIIYREPNVEIPYEKLVSACKVNADGMGIITIDRGKLHLRKHFFEKGNDPEVLAKALEDNRGQHTYVHLRFTTRGKTNKDNVHPFGVLKEKKHGMDLQFMHNGTLSDFGNITDCDSKDFARKLLTPLSEKFLRAADDPSGFILDDTYNAILKKYAGSSSVFLLADNFGNHTIINADNGKEFEGWWASNEYSFNRYHREPKTTYSSSSYDSRAYGYGYGASWVRDNDADYRKMYGNQAASEAKDTKVVTLPAVPGGKPSGDTRPPFNDEIPFETAKAEAKKEVVATTTTFPKRADFCEMAGVQSLSDVCSLSYEQIGDLIEEHPDMAQLLILDLLKELYDRDQEYDDRADYEKSVA